MTNQKITSRQYSIIIGLLLGDGSLYKDGKLQVEQGVKNEQYLKWLYSELKSLSGRLSSNVERIHPKTGTPSFSRRFYTKKYFADLAALFYENKNEVRKKIIPIQIQQLLDPVVLAVWFMDDGGKAQNTPKAAYINVTNFTSSERILLQKAVLNVFGFQINIQKAGGNNQYNFYIPASSYERFYEIVSPTILEIPEMRYKIGASKD